MATYAGVEDVQARLTRTLTEAEAAMCATLLDDAGALIDSYKVEAPASVLKQVSCRMVIRVLGSSDGTAGFPLGSTQGSMSGLGYSQSWTMGSGGATGELYLSKADKQLLGISRRIGTHSPVEDIATEVLTW